MKVFQGCSVTYELTDYDDTGTIDFFASEPAKGTVSIEENRVTYTAESDAIGTDSFEVSLFRDESPEADTVWYFTVSIMDEVLTPPLQNLTVSENSYVDFDLKSLFPPGLSYVFAIFKDGAAGTAALQDGTVT